MPSAGVSLVTAWSRKVCTALPEVPCSGLVDGRVSRTLIVSVGVTAEARVSVTVLPERATPFSATARRTPFTVTWKALGAGTEPGSRFSVRVTVSVFPSTAALRNVGRGPGGAVKRSETCWPFVQARPVPLHVDELVAEGFTLATGNFRSPTRSVHFEGIGLSIVRFSLS